MGRGGSNDRPFHGPTRSTLEGLADYVWIGEQEVLLGVEERTARKSCCATFAFAVRILGGMAG